MREFPKTIRSIGTFRAPCGTTYGGMVSSSEISSIDTDAASVWTGIGTDSVAAGAGRLEFSSAAVDPANRTVMNSGGVGAPGARRLQETGTPAA